MRGPVRPVTAERPQSTRTETMRYGAGYVIFAAGRVLRDLAVARLLGPATFGVWSMLLVYRQYSNYTDFGFTNGLGRVLPKLLQDGKELEARRAMGTGWVVAMAGTLGFALAIASRFLLSFHLYSAVTLWGVATVTTIMFLDKHYMYSSVVFRSAQRVGESGLWMGFLGALELALGVALTRRFGLYGLYVSVLLALLSAVACMYVRQPLRCLFKPDQASFRVLLNPSLTLMGLGLGSIAIHNVDRLVILWAFGPGAELGEYQVAASLSLVVSQLPYILLTVLVPKLYRFDDESRAELRRYLLPLTAMTAIAGIVVGSIASVVLPDVMRWMLPKYHLAASLAIILMLGEVWFAVAMVGENLLVAMDRGLSSLLLRGISIVSGMAASWWALIHGYSLLGVAWAMCAAQASAALALGWRAARATKIAPARYLVVTIVPVSYAIAVLTGMSVVLPSSSGVFQTVMKLVVCCLALWPLTAVPLWFFGIRLPGVHRIIGYLQWSEVA